MKLEAKIRKRYGNFLLDAAFTAESGAPLALLGPSGAGKSAALRCLAGIDRLDYGRILLDGRPLFDSEKRICLPPQKRKIGYLFQQYALFPHMTVAQNIAVCLRHLPKGRRRARTAELTALLRLEGTEGLLPRQLSGGQQQRVALARILALEPDVILLDEPLSALDGFLKGQLELELGTLLERFGGPVLWVSHDLGEVYRGCRRVCVLDGGRSSPVTSFPALLSDPETLGAAKISGCGNFAAVRPGEKPGYLSVPEWGLVLRCGRPWRDGVALLGIRADRIQPTAAGEENAFRCRVGRVVEDVDAVIVLLLPEGAAEDAAALRMRIHKEKWAEWAGKGELLVAVRPEDILLLRE